MTRRWNSSPTRFRGWGAALGAALGRCSSWGCMWAVAELGVSRCGRACSLCTRRGVHCLLVVNPPQQPHVDMWAVARTQQTVGWRW